MMCLVGGMARVSSGREEQEPASVVFLLVPNKRPTLSIPYIYAKVEDYSKNV